MPKGAGDNPQFPDPTRRDAGRLFVSCCTASKIVFLREEGLALFHASIIASG